MFPESRLMLGMLTPLLGVFFGVCLYFTSVWETWTGHATDTGSGRASIYSAVDFELIFDDVVRSESDYRSSYLSPLPL